MYCWKFMYWKIFLCREFVCFQFIDDQQRNTQKTLNKTESSKLSSSLNLNFVLYFVFHLSIGTTISKRRRLMFIYKSILYFNVPFIIISWNKSRILIVLFGQSMEIVFMNSFIDPLTHVLMNLKFICDKYIFCGFPNWGIWELHFNLLINIQFLVNLSIEIVTNILSNE